MVVSSIFPTVTCFVVLASTGVRDRGVNKGSVVASLVATVLLSLGMLAVS